jgi:hypothetical protein
MNKELDKSLLDYDGELPDEVTIPEENIPPPHSQHIGTSSNKCMAFAGAGIARIFYKKWSGEDILM